MEDPKQQTTTPPTATKRVHCFDVTPDTPEPGVTFYDQAPLLNDPHARRRIKKEFVRHLRGLGVNTVVGLEARGFPWAQALADELQLKLVLIRKKGKMHGPCYEETYTREYGQEETCVMQKSAMDRHARVVIIDDVLATGGTAAAAIRLVEQAGAVAVAAMFVLQMTHLGGMDVICATPKRAVYDSNQFPINLHVYAAYTADTSGNVVATPASSYQLPGLGWTELDDREGDPIASNKVIVMWNESCTLEALHFVKEFDDQCRPVPIRWDEFPDTNPNFTFSNIRGEEFVNRDVVYFASSLTQTELVRTLHMLTVLPRQGIRSLVVPMMYMGSSTHERVTREGVVASADLYAHLLESAMRPQTRTGPTDLILYDIHAPSTRFFFGDSCRVATPSAIGNFLSTFRGIPTPVGVTSGPRQFMVPYGIVFPDLGAYKRFAHEEFVEGVPTIICAKQRGEDGQRRVRVADTLNIPENKDLSSMNDVHWYMCDDLVHSGNTAYECALELRRCGIRHLSLYATHAVFENLAWMDFLPGRSKAVFDRIFVTSSVPSVAREHLVHYEETFLVLPLTDDIARHMNRIIPRRDGKTKDLFPVDKYMRPRLTENQLATAAYETRSPCKTEAIKRVFPYACQTFGVFQPPATLSPQPINYEEIEAGALARCKFARAERGSRVSIGIESGIVGIKPAIDFAGRTNTDVNIGNQEQVYHDVTDVQMLISGYPVFHATVTGPRIPRRVVEKVLEAEKKKTAGEFIAEMFPEQKLDHRDWYNVQYTGADFEGEYVPFRADRDMRACSRADCIVLAFRTILDSVKLRTEYDPAVKYVHAP